MLTYYAWDSLDSCALNGCVLAEGNTSNDTNFTNETEVGCLESPKVRGFGVFYHGFFLRLSSHGCLLWPRRCMFRPWMIFPAPETQLVADRCIP